jgi:hypothetical protein
MAFNKKEYKVYKKFMDGQLKAWPNPEIYTSLKNRNPLDFVCGRALSMLSRSIHDENYEACQAIADSLRELFDRLGHPIPEEALFNIKAPNLDPIHCHVSYVRCKMSGL